jgi:putative glutamine amidotransferase
MNRNNSRWLLLLLFLITFCSAFAQNFFDGDFDRSKQYLLLAHPTKHNLRTVCFLTENRLLEPGKVEFVGVYYAGEAYDYSESARYIAENKLEKFHLQEVAGNLSVDNIYGQNELTQVLKKLFENSVGVIFFGGPDIQPEAYGQENLYSDVTDPNRHLFELTFQFHLLGGSRNPNFVPFLSEKPSYLVTGFCLGMQTMNVATGGTLIQDIPVQVYQKHSPDEILKMPREQLHRNYWQELSSDTTLMGINFHPLVFTDDLFFPRQMHWKNREMPWVLSSHHQAVGKLGENLVVTARSNDGKIIEGIRHKLYPHVWAVQFHPEVPALYDDDEPTRFSPAGEAKLFPDWIGKNGQAFHQKYWAFFSGALAQAVRSQKKYQLVRR